MRARTFAIFFVFELFSAKGLYSQNQLYYLPYQRCPQNPLSCIVVLSYDDLELRKGGLVWPS
jgi:hypothetical protein